MIFRTSKDKDAQDHGVPRWSGWSVRERETPATAAKWRQSELF